MERGGPAPASVYVRRPEIRGPVRSYFVGAGVSFFRHATCARTGAGASAAEDAADEDE